MHQRAVPKRHVTLDEMGPLFGVQVCVLIWPIGSMYGIFTNIYPINDPNVGKYTIHGSYGWDDMGNME